VAADFIHGVVVDRFSVCLVRVHRHGLTWTLIESISAKISERTGKSVSYAPDSRRDE
jgi:hypothetical protein